MREPSPFRAPALIAGVGLALTAFAVWSFFRNTNPGLVARDHAQSINSLKTFGPMLRADEKTGVVEVELPDERDREAVAAARWSPEQWAALLAVRVVGDGGGAGAPPVQGSYRVVGSVLRFEPAHPPAPGVRYRAVFDPAALPSGGGGREKLQVEFSLPRAPRGPTAVERVYPSADELPENLLRFYVHFTGPMARGGAYDHVRLLGGDGKAVGLPFLELDEELWIDDGRRLTLLIDPGRIKRGLKPREDVGPVLEAGKRYTLVIDRDWPDAAGAPLREGYRKAFRAVAPRAAALDPGAWRLRPPAAGTRRPLAAAFAAPLDHALLLRTLAVTDAAGRPVAGTGAAADGEAGWEFAPDKPWAAGAYRLTVDPRLEDVAGNRVGRPFEVDLARPAPDAAPAALAFTVAP